MGTSASELQRILDSLLRLEFGDRMAARWASNKPDENLPLKPEDLFVAFLGKSATTTMLRALTSRGKDKG